MLCGLCKIKISIKRAIEFSTVCFWLHFSVLNQTSRWTKNKLMAQTILNSCVDRVNLGCRVGSASLGSAFLLLIHNPITNNQLFILGYNRCIFIDYYRYNICCCTTPTKGFTQRRWCLRALPKRSHQLA